MKTSVFYFIILILFISCQPENRVFIENQELSPNVEWLKSDKKTFKVDVKDNSIDYKLILSFRYATGFQYKNVIIKTTEISPSGVEDISTSKLQIRDDNGDYIGEPGFDIWDSEHTINNSKEFPEKGEYTYIIEHNMSDDILNFAMEVGLILDKKNN